MAELGVLPVLVDADDPRLRVFAERPLKLAHAIAGIVKFIDMQPAAKQAEIARACAAVGVTPPSKVHRG